MNGTAGLEAVQQVIVELEDPNREHPLALDEQLAQGLKKSLSLLDKSHLEACQIVRIQVRVLLLRCVWKRHEVSFDYDMI